MLKIKLLAIINFFSPLLAQQVFLIHLFSLFLLFVQYTHTWICLPSRRDSFCSYFKGNSPETYWQQCCALEKEDRVMFSPFLVSSSLLPVAASRTVLANSWFYAIYLINVFSYHHQFNLTYIAASLSQVIPPPPPIASCSILACNITTLPVT